MYSLPGIISPIVPTLSLMPGGNFSPFLFFLRVKTQQTVWELDKSVYIYIYRFFFHKVKADLVHGGIMTGVYIQVSFSYTLIYSTYIVIVTLFQFLIATQRCVYLQYMYFRTKLVLRYAILRHRVYSWPSRNPALLWLFLFLFLTETR